MSPDPIQVINGPSGGGGREGQRQESRGSRRGRAALLISATGAVNRLYGAAGIVLGLRIRIMNSLTNITAVLGGTAASRAQSKTPFL